MMRNCSSALRRTSTPRASASDPVSRRRSRAATLLAGVVGSLVVSGCAGGVPLMHPAHVLPPGNVTVGAGVAGQVGGVSLTTSNGSKNALTAEELSVAPGVAPWANGRIGITGDNEASLTYSGRSLRLGVRHAFPLGKLHLSTELGGTAVLPRTRSDDEVTQAFGGGADVPILLGWTSDAELYSLWGGPRAGFNLLSGQVLPSLVDNADPAGDPIPFDGTTWSVGGVVGARVGFRTFHAVLEMGVAYLRADGTFGEVEVGFDQLVITPGGAFNVSF